MKIRITKSSADAKFYIQYKRWYHWRWQYYWDNWITGEPVPFHTLQDAWIELQKAISSTKIIVVKEISI